MSLITLTELVPTLQLAVGPVILISGVGLLLLTLTNRFGRMLDRSRTLVREMTEGVRVPAAVANLRAQVAILQRRARLLRLAIALVTTTVLCVGVLILGLFIAALLRVEIAALLVAFFCGAILALIGAMVAFLAEINLSLKAAQLDWEMVARQDRSD
ncbi:MAG: DUF2721 domain-containing protein [Undibacterium sp.]|nr:DUF2721 domain-containing protein [Opitutaceae bacterium]